MSSVQIRPLTPHAGACSKAGDGDSKSLWVGSIPTVCAIQGHSLIGKTGDSKSFDAGSIPAGPANLWRVFPTADCKSVAHQNKWGGGEWVQFPHSPPLRSGSLIGKAVGCKPTGIAPLEVRVLPAPPFFFFSKNLLYSVV